jgi:glucokinase
MEIRGLGMAIPGAIGQDGIINGCVNIGWGRTNLRALAAGLFPELYKPVPDSAEAEGRGSGSAAADGTAAGLAPPGVRFGNDATVAALGELWRGAGSSFESAYLITLGTGVGGGFASKGGVVPGFHGAAGEIGHMTVNALEDVRCTCRRCGCLEQYASARGAAYLAENLLRLRDEMKAGGDPGGQSYLGRPTLHIERIFGVLMPEDPLWQQLPRGTSDLDGFAPGAFTAKDICDFAAGGDAFCRYVLKVWGRCLGMAMSYISCSIDPEAFMIGGGMSRGGEVVLEAVTEGFAHFAYPACRDTKIVKAELGNDAGIYGCVRMLLA